MNRSSPPAIAIVSILAAAVLVAGCGGSASAPGEAGGGAGAAAGAGGVAAGTPAAAGASTQAAAAAGKHGPRRLRATVATGRPHHRRPSHSAPLLYSRR